MECPCCCGKAPQQVAVSIARPLVRCELVVWALQAFCIRFPSDTWLYSRRDRRSTGPLTKVTKGDQLNIMCHETKWNIVRSLWEWNKMKPETRGKEVPCQNRRVFHGTRYQISYSFLPSCRRTCSIQILKNIQLYCTPDVQTERCGETRPMENPTRSDPPANTSCSTSTKFNSDL